MLQNDDKTSLSLPPLALALLGLAVYLGRALQNVRGRTSFLDEGLYQYKGWLYATGRAVPFADYAPWTNHMPLSYLVPGYVQKWFGPSLETGRYLSVGFALLFLLGLWLTVRRWGGDWLAAGAVWAFALNLASIKIYSMGLPQAQVAALFVWTLFLVLDEDSSGWRVALAGVLSALMVMTRLNMALVLPLLWGYVWWQHGLKKAGIYLGTAALLMGSLHLLFWPGILKLWAAWLPRSLTPFLDPWRLLDAGLPLANKVPKSPLAEYWLYLWESLRLHFLTLGSALGAWLLWPSRWEAAARRKAAVFLSALLAGLYLLHLGVAFTGGFCVSCIVLYETYFEFLGLALLAVVWPERARRAGLGRTLTTFGLSALTFAGLTYAAAGDVIHSAWYHVVRPLLEPLRVWRLLAGRGGISPGRAMYYLNAFLLALLLAAIAMALAWRRSGRRRPDCAACAPALLLVLLAAGTLFTPTRILGSGNDFFSCAGYDVPAAYRETGEVLSALLPAGAQVAWVGRLPAIFLYLPDVTVYPPQLNHYHSFRLGGDDETIYRFSRWNESLGRRWMQEADYTLIEKAWLEDSWVQDALRAARLQEVAVSPPPEPCRSEASRIHVFAPVP